MMAGFTISLAILIVVLLGVAEAANCNQVSECYFADIKKCGPVEVAPCPGRCMSKKSKENAKYYFDCLPNGESCSGIDKNCCSSDKCNTVYVKGGSERMVASVLCLWVWLLLL